MIKETIEIEIPFHDVDVMHVVWHGHYIKYFELARTKLMQKLNLDVPELKEHQIAMPVVDLKVKYKSPLEYAKKFMVEAKINEFELPEFRVEYKIYDQDDKVYCQGYTRQLYYQFIKRETFYEVPELVLERIKKHV